MGHAPQVYTGIKDKKDIVRICERHTAVNCDRQENESGSYGNSLTYLDRIFDTEREVDEYLMHKILSSNYHDYAARYKVAPKESAKLKKLKERLMKMRKDYSEYTTSQTPKNTVKKSAYISCKECGSKLAVKYLSIHQSSCPLCGHTLRSNTAIARIDKYKVDIAELEKSIRVEEKNLSSKSTKILWAVGTDCHT